MHCEFERKPLSYLSLCLIICMTLIAGCVSKPKPTPSVTASKIEVLKQKKLAKKLDYNNHGGALFVGVNKAVIKAHGSSKRQSMKVAVLQAVSYADFNIADKITEKLALQEEVQA